VEAHLRTLRLILKALDIPLDVSSIDGRIAMQKAIYLAQVAGLPLGYDFNWYVKGPYSRSLADDYYRAATEPAELGDRDLKKEYRDRLEDLSRLLRPPAGVALPQPAWLELLASWHYQRVRSGRAAAEAEQMMQRQKPHVAAEAQSAEQVLRQHGLLPA